MEKWKNGKKRITLKCETKWKMKKCTARDNISSSSGTVGRATYNEMLYKYKTVVGCTPVTNTSFSWCGQGNSHRAHPTRGQEANLANEKCEADVHVRIKRRRRTPVHTEYSALWRSNHPELLRGRSQRRRLLRPALSNLRNHARAT